MIIKNIYIFNIVFSENLKNKKSFLKNLLLIDI